MGRDEAEPVRVDEIHQLVELLEMLDEELYVRFSAGPAADRDTTSVDGESGCALPGLSVNPLGPEPWWDRPSVHWVARQLCQYQHLRGGDRYAWVLTGRITGRGPDSEPLVDQVRPIAIVDDTVLAQAQELYAEAFHPGRVPRSEDRG